ncbi:cell division protein FtsQ/DivIB [Brachybacterium sp. P6-10-X1]|uniref:cell division protein FtsQ/DivIB n=1 Tax=Brachybacterium sp. P6-10-X1 TaxID=1903186 RepID=UPI0020A2F929|nr:FtsQ-type POTRA domain-containing protein [Brachybacterium sp. P6-10-X1]
MGRSSPAPSRAEATPPADPAPEGGGGRVVQAAGRFRELVAGRPWRRRRRAILATAAATALILLAALSAAIFLPALQLQQVAVSGLGYVEEDEVLAAVEPYRGDSVLLLGISDIAADVTAVPGVRDAEVDRSWPDGVRVSVTEAEPVGVLTRPDGSTAVVDAQGQELPEAAADGADLVPLTVDPGAADPEGAAVAMSEVLASMPADLRGSVQTVTASSRSDVRFALALEDGGARTVVWGDAADAELKAEVVQALLAEPGSEIDVSSPMAPVTR